MAGIGGGNRNVIGGIGWGSAPDVMDQSQLPGTPAQAPAPQAQAQAPMNIALAQAGPDPSPAPSANPSAPGPGGASGAPVAGLQSAMNNPDSAIGDMLLSGPASLRQGIGQRSPSPMAGLASAGLRNAY